MTTDVARRPRLFISYSHDSADHAARVKALADELSASFEVHIDIYEPDPPQGWPQWSREQNAQADFVLLVCTETYLRRVDRKEGPGAGQGATFEAILILQEFYEAQGMNTKFIPVYFTDGDVAFVPDFLRGWASFHVGKEEGRARLRDRVRGLRPLRVPQVGQARLEADDILAQGPVPDLVVKSGFLRLRSPFAADALFEGTDFSIELQGIELGVVGPLACRPCTVSTRLRTASSFQGSWLGHGPARLNSVQYDRLSYGGRITLVGPEVSVSEESIATGLTQHFVFSAFISGYLRSAFIPDPFEPSLRARLYGEGILRVRFRSDPGPAGGILLTAQEITYSFLRR